MTELAREDCRRPRRGDPPLSGAEAAGWHARLTGNWSLVDDHHLEKEFRFDDFRQALGFVQQVGAVAEAMDHHPEIWFTWGRVRVTIWTHAVGGLSPCDFIFAARLEALTPA